MKDTIGKQVILASNPELRSNYTDPHAQEAYARFRDIHKRIRDSIYTFQDPTEDRSEIQDAISILDVDTFTQTNSIAENSTTSTGESAYILPGSFLGPLRKTSSIISKIVFLIARLIEEDASISSNDKESTFHRMLNDSKTSKHITLISYGHGDIVVNMLELLSKDTELDPTYFQITEDTLTLNEKGRQAAQAAQTNTTTYTGCPARHVKSTSGFTSFVVDRAHWELTVYSRLWKRF